MRKQSFTCINLVMTLILATFIGSYPLMSFSETAILTDEQSNAMAMLNHITVLTQSINESKNSRLYLEEVYSSIINNIDLNQVDEDTSDQIIGLLDTINNYRMVEVKRDRLRFIYDQNQAQAIRAAVPNPLALISAAQSFRPGKIAASIVYMAVDSITSYTSHLANTDLQYLKDGWALDDDQSAVLHNSRTNSFKYMRDMVDKYKLSSDLVLREGTVEDFVKWKNNDNIDGRIRSLVSARNTYKSYGGYWLTLAESYYSKENYTECLEAVKEYESLKTHIFEKDYEYARILPLAISAAAEVYSNQVEMYVSVTSQYAKTIIDNSEPDDWALRYFAAQTYTDLYGIAKDKALQQEDSSEKPQTEEDVTDRKDQEYLKAAYDIVLDNVNHLAEEQRKMNAAFLAPVKDIQIPKDAEKDEKDQINNYNKMLKETRKRELPPVYEPLLLNCELLFSISDELRISDYDKTVVNNILHPQGARIFLTESLDSKYWFILETKTASIDHDIDFGGTAMVVPITYLTANPVIYVEVKEQHSNEAIVLSDLTLDKIDRKTEGDVTTYQATYVSREARNHNWQPDAKIIVNITSKSGSDSPDYRFEYKTSGIKKEWYDYLKVWEGHKNNWYDYAKVWENSVIFERVK